MQRQRQYRARRQASGFDRILRSCVFLFLISCGVRSEGQLSFQTDGGAAVTGTGPFHSGFGAVNGLGIGVPAGGITMLSSNFAGPGGQVGTLYTTPYGVNAFDPFGNKATVFGHITANFTKPNAVALYSCPVGGACGTTGGYSLMSTVAGAPTTIWATTPPGGGLAQAYFGLWVSNGNGTGATAFTGTDSVTLSITGKDLVLGLTSTQTFILDTPLENVQSAVELGFSQGVTTVNGGAPCVLGGSVVVGSASDVSFNLGAVDGLGISIPTCGGRVAAVAVGAPSATYATSYKVTPTFSGITTSPAPAATVALTTPGFANGATLTVKEGATAAAMTTLPAAGTTHAIIIPASNTAVERFIGLTILNNNAGAVTQFPSRAAAGPFAAAADAALVTFTMTVN